MTLSRYSGFGASTRPLLMTMLANPIPQAPTHREGPFTFDLVGNPKLLEVLRAIAWRSGCLVLVHLFLSSSSGADARMRVACPSRLRRSRGTSRPNVLVNHHQLLVRLLSRFVKEVFRLGRSKLVDPARRQSIYSRSLGKLLFLLYTGLGDSSSFSPPYISTRCRTPPHKWFIVGRSSPFIRHAEHLTSIRAWCQHYRPGRGANRIVGMRGSMVSILRRDA